MRDKSVEYAARTASNLAKALRGFNRGQVSGAEVAKAIGDLTKGLDGVFPDTHDPVTSEELLERTDRAGVEAAVSFRGTGRLA